MILRDKETQKHVSFAKQEFWSERTKKTDLSEQEIVKRNLLALILLELLFKCVASKSSSSLSLFSDSYALIMNTYKWKVKCFWVLTVSKICVQILCFSNTKTRVHFAISAGQPFIQVPGPRSSFLWIDKTDNIDWRKKIRIWDAAT